MNWPWSRKPKEDPEPSYLTAISQVFSGFMYFMDQVALTMENLLRAALSPFMIFANWMDDHHYTLQEWNYMADVMSAMRMFDEEHGGR